MTSRQHGWQTSDPQGPGQHSLTLQGTQTPRISRKKKERDELLRKAGWVGVVPIHFILQAATTVPGGGSERLLVYM